MIARILFRNPQLVWLIVAGTLVAGVSSFLVMPRLEDPILQQRVGVITTSLVGADAVEVESTVTTTIEQWLNEFATIKQVRSNTRANVTNIVVELADSVNEPDEVWAAIERKLQANANQLPAECSEPELSVFPLKAFGAILAIVPGKESKSDLRQEFRLARELQTRLLRLKATESVEIFGSPGEELVVELGMGTLAETGLTTGSIAQQISTSGALPGGNLRRNGEQLSVEIHEPQSVLAKLEALQIEIPGRQQSVRLREIASVEIRPRAPATELAVIGGQRSVVLGVMVGNQYRVDLWNQELQKEIQSLVADFPSDVSIEPLFLQSNEIQQRMENLVQNLVITTLAVVLIVFLFMGWRCMLVVAISLPLSASLVICGLRFLSIPIHQMSVTGLIVSLGLLIDNAIVMVEEVRSRIFEGKPPIQAINESTRHLGLPLLGSTLTTVLAFLPIAIMPGPSGEFVGSLAVSVILAITASLLFAVTVVPVLVFLLGVNSKKQGLLEFGIKPGFFGSLYRGSLEFVFRRPVVGLLIGVVLPALGFCFASQLQKQFFPATDRAQIQIEVELPSSNNLELVEKSVDRISAVVESSAAVQRQHWFLGRSAPTFYYNVVPRRRATPNYAQAIIDLESSANIDNLVNRLQTEIDEEVFEARVIVRKLEQGPPFDAPVEVRILGDDLQTLEQLGNQVRLLLASTAQVQQTRSDLGDKALKLELHLDPGLEQRNNVSKQELSRLLYSSLEGVNAGTFLHDGLRVPARVVVDFANRSVTESLMSLQFVSAAPSDAAMPAGGGQPNRAPTRVAIGSVGDLKLGSSVGAIVRHNGRRVNEVKAYTRAGVLPSTVLAEFKSNLSASDFQLPQGYDLEFGGEDEKRGEAISTLVANVTIIVALMVVVLVAALGTFRSSLIVAIVAGLAIGLGPLALFCFGYPLGFMAIVGTMGLVGVAINDSIVVLAGAKEKFDAAEADAHSLAKQLAEIVVGNTRHILTTTFTTMIGFLPLVLFGGEFWPPLAIVISAGVGGATLLALYFTPTLFLLTQPKRNRSQSEHSNEVAVDN